MTIEHMTIEHGDAIAPRWTGGTRSRGPMPWRRGVLVVAALTIMAGLMTNMGYRLDAAAGTGSGAVLGVKQPSPTRAEQIKAAFIYNFTKFTNWPDNAFASSDTPLTLCTFGAEGLHSALHRIQGKRVKSRTLTTRHPFSVEEFNQCHLIFFGAAAKPRLRNFLRDLEHRPILTIGDVPRFIGDGGIINLETVNGKIRIEINVAAAEQAGLRFSSKLLRLSNVVRNSGAKGSN